LNPAQCFFCYCALPSYNTMNTTIAGLLGALIGSGASLLGLAIQQHYQTKRERLKIAADLALSEFKHDLELANNSGGGLIAPISVYVIYHARMLEEMSKGCITPETIKMLSEERNNIMAAFHDVSEEM
jgi:hypothetical protein